VNNISNDAKSLTLSDGKVGKVWEVFSRMLILAHPVLSTLISKSALPEDYFPWPIQEPKTGEPTRKDIRAKMKLEMDAKKAAKKATRKPKRALEVDEDEDEEIVLKKAKYANETKLKRAVAVDEQVELKKRTEVALKKPTLKTNGKIEKVDGKPKKTEKKRKRKYQKK